MRNACIFAVLLLGSLLCLTLLEPSLFTKAGYGLESPPPVTRRFTAATHSYLQPVEEFAELIAVK